MNFIYRVHAVERMFQRNISEAIVNNTVNSGKIIEQYLDDKPYPSFLVLEYHFQMVFQYMWFMQKMMMKLS